MCFEDKVIFLKIFLTNIAYKLMMIYFSTSVVRTLHLLALKINLINEWKIKLYNVRILEDIPAVNFQRLLKFHINDIVQSGEVKCAIEQRAIEFLLYFIRTYF